MKKQGDLIQNSSDYNHKFFQIILISCNNIDTIHVLQLLSHSVLTQVYLCEDSVFAQAIQIFFFQCLHIYEACSFVSGWMKTRQCQVMQGCNVIYLSCRIFLLFANGNCPFHQTHTWKHTQQHSHKQYSVTFSLSDYSHLLKHVNAAECVCVCLLAAVLCADVGIF